jgi:hypothetical protein
MGRVSLIPIWMQSVGLWQSCHKSNQAANDNTLISMYINHKKVGGVYCSSNLNIAGYYIESI